MYVTRVGIIHGKPFFMQKFGLTFGLYRSCAWSFSILRSYYILSYVQRKYFFVIVPLLSFFLFLETMRICCFTILIVTLNMLYHWCAQETSMTWNDLCKSVFIIGAYISVSKHLGSGHVFNLRHSWGATNH